MNFDTRVNNAAGTIAVSQWAGVDLDKGNNNLVVEVRDANGQLIEQIQRDVSMSNLPVRAEMVYEQSRLLADGQQTPVIAVRLYDRDDRPIREGLIGEFIVEAPYIAQQNIDDLKRQPLGGLDRGNPRYRVGKDGIHGATFSSVELHDESVSVSSSAVQIGDPIQEKRVLDGLLRARDAGLYRAVVHNCLAVLLRVDNRERMIAGGNRAGIADLAAGLCVKRRRVEDHGAVLAYFELIYWLAVGVNLHNPGLAFRSVIAEEIGFKMRL